MVQHKVMTMTPHLRKFALTVHVAASVGLLGAIAAFLALAVAGLTAEDERIVRAAYPAMDLIARCIIVPLAFGSLVTGFVQALGTPWGLLRHYWVVAKLLITAFATIILLIKMGLVGYAARLAAGGVLPSADLRAAGAELALHAAAGLLVLLVPTVLSIYKPRGLTPFGKRARPEERTPSHQPRRLSLFPSMDFSKSITITFPRAYVAAFVFVVLVAHIVVMHFTGIGLAVH